MSAQPVEQLELRALEQRRQIHVTAEELKGKLTAAREKLNIRRNLREHMFAVALAVAVGAGGLLLVSLIVRKLKR